MRLTIATKTLNSPTENVELKNNVLEDEPFETHIHWYNIERFAISNRFRGRDS